MLKNPLDKPNPIRAGAEHQVVAVGHRLQQVEDEQTHFVDARLCRTIGLAIGDRAYSCSPGAAGVDVLERAFRNAGVNQSLADAEGICEEIDRCSAVFS